MFWVLDFLETGDFIGKMKKKIESRGEGCAGCVCLVFAGRSKKEKKVGAGIRKGM